jgi:hypothetical protein
LADLTKPVPEMRRSRAPRVAADRQRKPAKRSVRSSEPAEKHERKETRGAGASHKRKSTGKKRSDR